MHPCCTSACARPKDAPAWRLVSSPHRDKTPRSIASHVMALLDSFPSKYAPREIQKKVIADIESALDSGYKNILLCVPTGVGKSHIAVTVAKQLGSSFIVTAQKILQDQYIRDFEFLSPMKGKANFPCMALYDYERTPYHKAKADPFVACSLGTCSWMVKIGPKQTKTEYCQYKPNISSYDVLYQGKEQEAVVGSASQQCYYYDQKFKAMHATHALFNYASYFQTRLYPKGLEPYLERDCLIADEAHEIEEQIIGYIGIDISAGYMRDAGLGFSDFDLGTVDGAMDLLDALGDSYTRIIRKEENSNPQAENAQRLRRRREKIDLALGEIRDNAENFVVQEHAGAGVSSKLSIKPIEVSSYVGRFFDMEHQVFMSATIHKDAFCSTMGMPESDCAFVEVERSPFPVENRSITFHNIRRLNYASTDADYEAVYGKVREILGQYGGKKGLILTTTKKQCHDIEERMQDRVVVAHEQVEGKREAILKQHQKTDKPNVIASPSFWYGVDLKDDLSRFQIILKAPYLSMADKRTKIKAKRDPQWYRYAALVKLLQGFGRSVRSEDDYCDTHVLDESAERLLTSMRKFVPKAYHDALGWS